MFKSYLFILLLYFTAIVWCKLPNDIEQCPAGDHKCIINNINHIFQTKLNGDEDLGLVKLKPMDAGTLVINQGIELVIKDTKLEGVETVKAIKIKGFGSNPEGVHEITFKSPVLSLLGDYKGKGKILIFSLEGAGKANLTLVEPVFKLTISGKSLTKDEQVFLDVTSTVWELKNKKEFIVYYSNLFNGDKFLNEQFNALIKQESELLGAEFIPPVLEAVQKEIHKAVKSVFRKIPYNETNDIEQCPAGDHKCIINNINHIFQMKLNGYEELGLVKLKPMDAGTLVINQGIELVIKNMKLDGVETVKATKIKGFGSNPEGLHDITFKLSALLSLLYDYKGKDKVFVLSLEAEDPKPCKYGDSECLTKTIEYFLHEKNQGDKSINLVKIDPLEVKKISMKQGAESPVNIDLTFTNSNIYGLSNAKVTKVKGFGKDMTQKHEITLKCEQLDLVGDYNIKGRILVLPITGTGKSNITMLNVELIMKFTATPMEKDGATYMKINKFQLQPEPKDMIFKIDNLFNGDKALGDNMNLFLNENWSDIYKEISGSIGSAFGKIFQSVIGHVFTKYPYDQFLIE
ncbi:uncharacterized protein LOC135963553 [Calliphora vicina]|uniref:uncharacterized protein LOC135963553 n=1 Tax=Calliphora vicina TaxID=7373 RepID=UPI00325B9E80